MTLQKALEEYTHVYLPARNYSERTKVEYTHVVEDFIQVLETNGITQVERVEFPHVERYLAELDKRGEASATRKRKVVTVRSFLSYLYQYGHTSVNLAHRIIPPQLDFKTPIVLTETQYKRLLMAAEANVRNFAIIQLLLQTGIKLSELTRLSVNDVDLPGAIFPDMKDLGYLQIMGTERKKERIIPLNYKASIALDNYLEERPATTVSALFLNRFEKRLGARGVEKIVRKYCDQTGIIGASVQSLRHTFGAHHAVKGTSKKTIQATMGFRDTRSIALYESLADEIKKKEIQQNAL